MTDEELDQLVLDVVQYAIMQRRGGEQAKVAVKEGWSMGENLKREREWIITVKAK